MRIPRDVIGGLALVAVGGTFYVAALNLRVGDILSMGPGYFPRVIALLLIGFGMAVVVAGLINAQGLEKPEWRPALAVLAGIAAFALTVRQIGLIPAMVSGVMIATTADTTSRFWPSLLLAIGAGIAAWLIFRVGLGLQLPGLRVPSWWR